MASYFFLSVCESTCSPRRASRSFALDQLAPVKQRIKDEDLQFALTTLAAKISPVLAFSTEFK
jgi:hypothetical protein